MFCTQSVTVHDVRSETRRLTRLRMAVVGVVITLAWLTACAAETEESRVAFVTLGSVHSSLTHTHP